jgi:hypothetical protein
VNSYPFTFVIKYSIIIIEKKRSDSMGVLVFVLFILMMLGTFVIDIFTDVSIRRNSYKLLFIGYAILLVVLFVLIGFIA